MLVLMKCGDKMSNSEKRAKTKNDVKLKMVTLDQAWVRTSDQGGVMGGRHEEIDGERGDDEFGYVRVRWGEERGVTLRRRLDKGGNCSPLLTSRFTLQHQNPSSHWSAHCSLHHDKRTLELPPSPMLCLLSFGSSSVLIPYGLLQLAFPDPWPLKHLCSKVMRECCKRVGGVSQIYPSIYSHSEAAKSGWEG